jgi:hypothetical protein
MATVGASIRSDIRVNAGSLILALLVARAVLHTARLAPTKGQVWDLLAGCRISEGHGYPVLTRKLRHSTRFVMEARFAHGCPAIHKHCAVASLAVQLVSPDVFESPRR